MPQTFTGKERYHTHRQDLDWNEERASAESRSRNVGDLQRLLSAIGRFGLLATGLPRRPWSGAALSIAGAG